MKKKKKQIRTSDCQYKREKWFIENDYQVCIINVGSGRTSKYKVTIRRKGITTEGKDYKYVGGVRIDSHYWEVETLFKNYEEANEYCYELRDQLERDYHA